MKEQLAKMTIIELVRTANNYSTSIKQTGVYSELVREIASRLEALNLAHIGAMAALQKRCSADAQEPVAVSTVSFYRDGVVAAAAWVDAQREAYDSEHGRHDPDTGAFEFENDAQQEYSTTLAEVADGIRSLHPNTTQPVAVTDDTSRLDWLDAQNKRLNEYYGTSYGWKFDANFQRNAMMLNDSNYPVMNVRQAIDEAMLAAPQERTK